MENKFCSYSTQDDPPLVVHFGESQLLRDWRIANDYNTRQNRAKGYFNLHQVVPTLINSTTPNADMLKEEESGLGRVVIFLKQTEAEFKSKICSPGDENALHGLGTNLLTVASVFYWANFFCRHLTTDWSLTNEKKQIIEDELDKIIQDVIVQVKNKL